MGKHKVPTVRNVGKGLSAITKAYTHNGYFKTLEGIVNFYNTRDVKPRVLAISPRRRPWLPVAGPCLKSLRMSTPSLWAISA